MKTKIMFGCVALAVMSAKCFAVNVDMKPGLWENTFKLTGGSVGGLQAEQQQQMLQTMGDLQKRFAEMPPEQREQIEAIMKQQGIDVDAIGLPSAGQKLQMSKEGAVIKECVTQAQIDSGELPSPEKNCTNKVVQRSKNVFKVSYECKGSSTAHGTTEVTFQNPKSFTGKVSYSPNGAAKGEVLQGDMSGKWLSSDCGAVKPNTEQVDDTEDDAES